MERSELVNKLVDMHSEVCKLSKEMVELLSENDGNKMLSNLDGYGVFLASLGQKAKSDLAITIALRKMNSSSTIMDLFGGDAQSFEDMLKGILDDEE